MIDFIGRTKAYRFDLQTESLGTIFYRSPTVGMLIEIENKLNEGDINGISFVRKILNMVGYRINEDGNGETEDVPVTSLDIDRLKDEEIEVFARDFLVNNGWLLESYKDVTRSDRTSKSGDKVVSVIPKKVDLPKQSAEQDSDYLVRVFRSYLDEKAERRKKMFPGFSSSIFGKTYSNTLRDQFNMHMSLSDQLGNTLRGIQQSIGGQYNEPVTKPVNLGIDTIPIQEDPTYETNRRLGDVLAYAEELRPIVLQSAELFRNMSDTALQLNADFNSSARKSSFVSLVLVGIGAMSLFLTALYSWWSYEQTSAQETLYQRYIIEQQTLIRTLSEEQDNRYRQLLDDQYNQLETMMERQDTQIERAIESFRNSNTIQLESDE